MRSNTKYLLNIQTFMNYTHFVRKITDTCRVAKAVKVTLEYFFIVRDAPDF